MNRLLISLCVCVMSAAPAFAKDRIAFAYCPMTHTLGHGRNADLSKAIDAAMNDCVIKGGVPACCFKFHGEDTAAERAQVIQEADGAVKK